MITTITTTITIATITIATITITTATTIAITIAITIVFVVDGHQQASKNIKEESWVVFTNEFQDLIRSNRRFNQAVEQLKG